MKVIRILLTFLIVPIWLVIAIPAFLIRLMDKGSEWLFRWVSALMLSVFIGKNADELVARFHEEIKKHETRCNN